MYSSYVMLFRETVSRAYERFALVRERAQRVRSANGLVRVPLTAGLAVGQSESQQGGSNSVKSRVLRSVLEGIEAPPAHISSTQASVKVDRVSHDDPLQLGQSIEELMTRRGLGGRGESQSKIPRLEEENPVTKTILAMSRYCQEQWVRNMVKLHMSRGERMKLALLSGDAGCGKSYAVSLLEKKLKSMNVSVAVSAMTNKAAGTLMESGSLDRVYTFHKMMGFKQDLLDEKLSLKDFTQQYNRVHWNAISHFNSLRQSNPRDTNGMDWRHSCAHLRPESCAVCSNMFKQLMLSQKHPEPDPPPFLGMNVLIVDEYGLMNVRLLERMLCCLELFYGPEKGPLIIFSGSVSQLQPVGSSPRIWETEHFEGLLSSSTPLFVNRRQFKDPGYAEALTYLQFNTVTEESQRIFRSQVSVSELDVMDPGYEPEKLRIFHQDKQQITYTAACMNKMGKDARMGEKFLSVTRNRSSHKGPTAWYEVLKQAAQTLPKLFSTPKYLKGVRSTERDYLTLDKLWVGCKVRMIWHMNDNGIQVAPDRNLLGKPGERQRQRRQRQEQQQLSSMVDTEGVVRRIRYNHQSQFNEFYVKGEQTGTLYKVSPSTWNYMNWTVTTHPLACLLAMNTYDCQGCTVTGKVLYHPPRNFSMSPIKPSVYVVLTRVVMRENLQMTNCNFAETIGAVQFYDDRLVSYRKRVEMNYSS
ncbi:hypothetical protein D9C73_027520 [Collichthys lucidus]|uniref:Uncharacterized protein n=1 Tax=Collichthys lucidus TaxID=240159 RepID=A0A4U5VUR8_COLLU|nr:hypothetical protein D9C73_027520 [Collichthys lucidus]